MSVVMKKLDIEKLNEEQLAQLQKTISDRMIDIINKANKDANEFLSAYDIEAQLVIELKKKQ
jgi:hypothetical protein